MNAFTDLYPETKFSTFFSCHYSVSGLFFISFPKSLKEALPSLLIQDCLFIYLAHCTACFLFKIQSQTGKTTRKLLNGMTKHKTCKARSLFLQVFDESPAKSGQVRWFCDWMHYDQIQKLGVINLR